MDGWESDQLTACITQVPIPEKIPRKQFQDSGPYPIVSQEKEFINGFWSSESDVVRVKSPLVLFGDHTQVLKYIDFDFVVGADGTKLLQPKPFLNAKYFYYFLMAHPIDALGYARHFRLLRELTVRYPKSLPEQERIVAILDEAFAAIATATANTEINLASTQDVLDTIIARACIGEMTSEWRRERRTESSSSLVSKAIEQRRQGWTGQGDCKDPMEATIPSDWTLPKGWCWASLDAICPLFVDSPHRTPKYTEVGIPALRPRDTVGGSLALDRSAHVSDDEFAMQTKRHEPQPGDIVYSRELSYGWAAEVPKAVRVCLSQGMCIFRPATCIDTSFFLSVLNGPIGRQQAHEAAVGTAHPHINLGDIKSYAIPIPCEAEQSVIAAMLSELSEETMKVTSGYETKLTLLAELKQSILHKAFAGELTAKAVDRELSEAGV